MVDSVAGKGPQVLGYKITPDPHSSTPVLDTWYEVFGDVHYVQTSPLEILIRCNFAAMFA